MRSPIWPAFWWGAVFGIGTAATVDGLWQMGVANTALSAFAMWRLTKFQKEHVHG
jgi:hypothetical protein